MKKLIATILVIGSLFTVGVTNMSAQLGSTQITTPGFVTTFEGAILDTPSNTPTVAFSIPVDIQKICFIEVLAVATDISGGNINGGAVGTVNGLCGRGAGNVGVFSTNPALLLNTLGLPSPTVNFAANTTTQAIDVTVVGKLNLPLRWNLNITIRMTQ